MTLKKTDTEQLEEAGRIIEDVRGGGALGLPRPTARRLPRFCKTCGKELIKSIFKSSVRYDEYNGMSYMVVDEILVCPDHEKDIFPSGHTRYKVSESKEYNLRVEEKP